MRQTELAAIVIEQSTTDQVFQAADLVGDRWLRAPDFSAGGCKSSCIDDGDERSEQGDVEILVQ